MSSTGHYIDLVHSLLVCFRNGTLNEQAKGDSFLCSVPKVIKVTTGTQTKVRTSFLSKYIVYNNSNLIIGFVTKVTRPDALGVTLLTLIEGIIWPGCTQPSVAQGNERKHAHTNLQV